LIPTNSYAPLGWNNKPALGLSIGCYFDSRDSRTYFFDVHTLEATMRQWVDEQPLLVGFNSAAFDLPLLRGLLRRQADTLPPEERAALTALCDAFKLLCATSYDILAEIWQADPATKRVKGLNGLGAIAAANGYGGKTGDGAQAPRLWAAGKIAEVVNYVSHDVHLTQCLFEMILHGQGIKRKDGSILFLPKPSFTIE
jgi:hypothetical protein